MTASSLTAALLLAGNEGCLSVVHICFVHPAATLPVKKRNLGVMTAFTRVYLELKITKEITSGTLIIEVIDSESVSENSPPQQWE